jgi:putative nucleotidyltransferase with HDIG domain
MTVATSQPSPRAQWRNLRFEVLESVEQLPSLGTVVVEFLAMASAEMVSAKDFEEILMKDQALVARLLKTANCGLYGRSRSVSSIPEAVVLIGLDNLKKLVYAVSAEGLTTSHLNHYSFHAEQGFWHHSMSVAHVAKIVAEQSPRCPLHPEEAFVAGLLHDVGMLVIDRFLSTPPGAPVGSDTEREAVGIDHAELAEYILRQWNLPESITAAVRHHHEPRQAGRWTAAAAALALAQGICDSWGIGYRHPLDLSEDVLYPRFLDQLDDLGLDSSNWDKMLWDVRQSLVQLTDIFISQ